LVSLISPLLPSSDEVKQRESVEKVLDEERKRSAELAEQLHSEQKLRAEAEKKLEQANKDVHEKVAKVRHSTHSAGHVQTISP
jgi:predicted  nucleic acid-binding Zn-ribbon protein